MFVMLLGSFTYAQTSGDNFDFSCIDLRTERINKLQALGDTNVSVVVSDFGSDTRTVITRNGNEEFNGVLYGLIGTWSVEKFDNHFSNVTNLVSDQLNLNIERAERLAYVQTLVSSNTTIVRSDDTEYNGNPIDGDVFSISYEGSTSTYIQRPMGIGTELLNYGNIEDMVEPYLGSFYLAISQWVGLAQSEYLESIVPPSASASNPLSDQSQLVYNVLSKDSGRSLRNNALRANDPIVGDATDGIVISISADTVLAHYVVVTLYNTDGTINSSTPFYASSYGNSDMPLMTVGDFNDYFDAIWNHINN